MWLVYFYGLVMMFTFTTSQARQTMYNNEWTPLIMDETYGKGKVIVDMDITPINRLSTDYKETDLYKEENVVKMIIRPDEETEDLHDIRSKAIKLVKPGSGLRFDHGNVFRPIEHETIKSVNELQSDDETFSTPDCEHINKLEATEKLQKDITDMNTRKSKAILIESSKNKVNDQELVGKNYKLNNDDTNLIRFTKDIGQEENRKSYRVTEDANEMLEDESTEMAKIGYFYTRPKMFLKNPVQNNFTNTLLDILSRHNIKPEDELPNYSLSRKTKTQDPLNAFMFIPVPLRVLPQFNNLKQLSVDPLLAVLMSNYGYYFPGSYGIHSRYRNLYGYLASNNIHNNKPFGSYKIFSDTDSSN